MSLTRAIQIDFPVGVEITNDDCRALDAVLTTICKRYRDANPTRTMWVFGTGSLMTINPFMVGEDHPLTFDDETLHIEIAERERYDNDPK